MADSPRLLPVDERAGEPVHKIRRAGRRIDMIVVCDWYARKEGTSLEEMLWNVAKGLHNAVVQHGDVRAARELVRLFAKDDAPPRALPFTMPPLEQGAAVAAAPGAAAELTLDGADMVDMLEDFDEWKARLRAQRPQLTLVPRVEAPKVPKTFDDLLQ